MTQPCEIHSNSLISLGISTEAVEQAQLTPEENELVFAKLKKVFISNAKPWQLQALAGRIPLVHETRSGRLTIAHLVAWSGNTELLRYVKKNQPELLSAVDQNGASIAHYAALSGNPLMLDCVQKYRPELLEKKTCDGVNIAHYAAKSGNQQMLERVQTYKPYLLTGLSNKNTNLAHYAAMSRDIALLDWVTTFNPTLLLQTNNDQLSIAHFAAKADAVDILQWIKKRNPEQLAGLSRNESTIAHFAALNGSINVLNWIKRKRPEWLKIKNKDGETIAHQAASGNNSNALQWIYDNAPELLAEKDNKGSNIAHAACTAKTVNTMQWINARYPAYLTCENAKKQTVAFYAAQMGNQIILNEIKNSRPDLLVYKSNSNYTLLEEAAGSGNADAFNWVHKHLGSPTSFTMRANMKCAVQQKFARTILCALDNNSSLLKLHRLRGTYSLEEYQSIYKKLAENIQLNKAMRVFSAIKSQPENSATACEYIAIQVLSDYKNLRTSKTSLYDRAFSKGKRIELEAVDKFIHAIEQKTAIRMEEEHIDALLSGNLMQIIANNTYLKTFLYWLIKPGENAAPQAANQAHEPVLHDFGNDPYILLGQKIDDTEESGYPVHFAESSPNETSGSSQSSYQPPPESAYVNPSLFPAVPTHAIEEQTQSGKTAKKQAMSI